MKRLIKSSGDTVGGKSAFDIAMDMWAAAPESLKSPSSDMKMHDLLADLLEKKYGLTPRNGDSVTMSETINAGTGNKNLDRLKEIDLLSFELGDLYGWSREQEKLIEQAYVLLCKAIDLCDPIEE